MLCILVIMCLKNQFSAMQNFTSPRARASRSSVFHSLSLLLAGVLFSQVLHAAPANDMRAAATALPTGQSFTVTGTNVGATREVGEPEHDAQETTASVWWSWTPAGGGQVLLTTAGSSFDTVLAVYTEDTGSSPVTLLPVVSDDEGAGYQGNSVASFTAVAGTTYYIAVASWSFMPPGSIQLSLMPEVTPVNDAFAQAQIIPDVPMLVLAPAVGLSTEPGEPASPFGQGTAWWKMTAAQAGRLVFSGNQQPEVYTGSSLGALTLVSVFDWSGNALVDVAENQTVWVRVSDNGWSPIVVLTVRQVFPPPNDDFANATTISPVSPVQVTGSNLDASVELNEPEAADFHWLNPTVWWKWTAPSSGPQTVSAVVTDALGRRWPFGFIEVFTGNSLEALTSVAAIQYAGAFAATSGTTYYLRYDNYGAGDVLLSIAPPPANDAFASAQPLVGSGIVTASGTLLGATGEELEPANHGQSVWYDWTAASTGHASLWVNFDDVAQTSLPNVQAFTGTALDALTVVPMTGGGGRRSFDAIAGTTYKIRVDSYGDRVFSPAGFVLQLIPGPANDSFANATVITNPGTLNSWNIGATRDVNDPKRGETFVSGVGGNSVWWQWTADSTDLAVFDTYGSNFDTVLHVFTGADLSTLTQLRASDNAREQKDSRVAFVPVIGQTYHIRVSGPTTNQQGMIQLNFSRLGAPVSADDHLAYGRSYLEGRSTADMSSADNHFSQALALDAAHPAANVLRAITRLARLQTDTGFASLLSQWGFQTIRTNLHSPRFDTSRDGAGKRVAPGGADASQANALASSALLPALAASEANLAQITSTTFSLALTDSEAARRWTVLDYGDLQVLRSVGLAIKAAIHMNNSVNTDGSLSTLLNLENQRKLNAKEILAALPNAGKLRGITDERSQFKTAVQLANTRYQEASTFVRARTDTAAEGHHLFRVGRRVRAEAHLRDNAAGLSQALDGSTVWAGRTVNLAPMLTTSSDYRNLVPVLRGNRAVVSTSPDPTFMGSLVGGTHEMANKVFKDNNLLYDITTFSDWAGILLGGKSPADQAPDADPDHDGISNLAEYVFALDPSRTSSRDEYAAEGMVPGSAPGESHFAITFIRLRSPSSVVYRVDVSDDLTTWDTTQTQIEQVGAPVVQPDGVSEQVTYRLIAPASTSAKKFLRVVAIP